LPCIFCFAVFAMLAGAVTTMVLDHLEAKLATIASEPVSRPVDSASVAKFETSVAVPAPNAALGRPIPVTVTIYKKHKRVRIQVMTHELTRAEAEAVEDLIATTLELRIVDRSDAHDEQKVREAFGTAAETNDDDEQQTVPAQPAEGSSTRPRAR